MGSLRKLKILGFAPLALWLLTQLAMAGMPIPAPAPALAPASAPLYSVADDTLPPLAICSQAGTTDSGTDGKASAGEQCRWCQSFGKAPPLATPQLAALQPTRVVTLDMQPPADQRPSGICPVFLKRSRAPPL